MRIPLQIPERGIQPYDVVGFGLNSIDLLTVVAEFPTSNRKQRLQRFARLPGGQIATALVTCSRLGWSTRYVGSFGDDDFGRFAQNNLVREGVDTSYCRVVAGATNQFAVVLVDASTGERTVMWDRHPLLTMRRDEVSSDAVTSGRVLIVDCHETAAATQAARYARAAGRPTFVDVEKVRPGIGDLLHQIDAIIAAQEFPTALTGYDDPARAIELMAREFDASVVCVTLGAEGSLTWCGGRHIRTPGYPVDCVDSTGAGDVFRGAFIAACLQRPEGPLEDALAFANAAAAINCRALGAQGGIPQRDEIEQLMAARSM
ncbi:MAG: ribokinase [Blastocatellia bacterium]|nr:MAG: ribokinase [Blastocatellia bacterium]